MIACHLGVRHVQLSPSPSVVLCVLSGHCVETRNMLNAQLLPSQQAPLSRGNGCVRCEQGANAGCGINCVQNMFHKQAERRLNKPPKPQEVCYSPQLAHLAAHTHIATACLCLYITLLQPDRHCQPSKAHCTSWSAPTPNSSTEKPPAHSCKLVVTAAAAIISRQFGPTPTALAHQRWPMSKPDHTSARLQPV